MPQTPKSEIRISKYEIMFKIQMTKIQKRFGYSSFCHLNLFRISCFEFQIFRERSVSAELTAEALRSLRLGRDDKKGGILIYANEKFGNNGNASSSL